MFKDYFKELLWVQRLVSLYKSKKLYKRYSKSVLHKNYEDKTVIFMIDGRISHGGLCDRLNGLISTYLFCREFNINFRVFWIYPFHLELFLEPNKYDWRIDKSDISYCRSESTPYYWGTIHNEKKQLKLAERILYLNTNQIHAYTNMHYKRENLHDSFYELFKLSPALKEAVNDNLEKLGTSYISVTFRFQRLLGDFDEGKFPILGPKERIALMDRCVKAVENIKESNLSIQRILVTSDSKTFLNHLLNKLNYVYSIDGELCHMDFIENESNELRHIKSFVDLIMISKAEKAYLAITTPMYRSSFAKTSAQIGGIPYEEYVF